MIRLEMKNTIWFNKEAVKITKYLKKIYKHEYFTGEEILPPDQRRLTEQAKFRYSPLGKTLEEHAKTTEDQRKKINTSNWRSWESIGWI